MLDIPPALCGSPDFKISRRGGTRNEHHLPLSSICEIKAEDRKLCRSSLDISSAQMPRIVLSKLPFASYSISPVQFPLHLKDFDPRKSRRSPLFAPTLLFFEIKLLMSKNCYQYVMFRLPCKKLLPFYMHHSKNTKLKKLVLEEGKSQKRRINIL